MDNTEWTNGFWTGEIWLAYELTKDEAFKEAGRRNGNFHDTTESNDKILKINCHSCNNEIVIDCSKLPTNIKTLDTMCPNCKSFIKYGNLNYVDNQKNNDISNKKIIISAIEKVGIPTKQIENNVLFVSSDNAVVDNKKVLIDDKKFFSIRTFL